MLAEMKNSFQPKYESIFRFLDEPPHEDVTLLRKAFKHITDMLDKEREESFTEVFPYYKEWYDKIEESDKVNLLGLL